MTERTLEVILTHEHTDFDALASMLGAAVLYPDALPVLPRQMNRNVDEFIVLYKDQLPFVTDDDLPKQKVARAILVDTRSVNWVKGMDHKTEQHIIDHHEDSEDDRKGDGAEDDGPSGDHEIDPDVGANTTLLIEKLIEQDYSPSPVEATLLALGIHEDTGNLTYASTSHRDARALAWLLQPQHNVNRDVLVHFLNHPLSPEQRTLLHRLIDASEFLDISGHKVVIAQAEATGFRDELSALAARLRDFHETDAVFIIVDLGDIIQVVARSSTDSVDVGEVATALGGGGHTRAAAAPLQSEDSSTQSVRDHIATLVKGSSKSVQTVSQIMSIGRPQVVPPTMLTKTAAEIMSRYGHEGFPVVSVDTDGKEELLGILTRRQTDRAMNHGMGEETVRKIMRSGQVTVLPSDSVATLRRRMVDNNWGQVPVVDETNQIIGIVTRTDLIKLWDEPQTPANLAATADDRLQRKLSPVQYAMLRLIGIEVDRLQYTVYVVGGFVRDLLLDQPRPIHQEPDVDIVLEGNAIEFANHMQASFGGRVVPHKRFRTAKWILDDDEFPVDRQHLIGQLRELDEHVITAERFPAHLDFVSARTEFYTAPTALPTIETSSIKLDLHRRDFTINTLAICLNPERWGDLLDFYGGSHDLRSEKIRILHSLSFVDDPTRILRAVRYEQRFGFTTTPRTLELLLDALPLLDRVSGARIRHEIERIMQEDEPERSLIRLTELQVLQRLHPALVADEWLPERFELLRAERTEAKEHSALCREPLDHLYWGLLTFRLPTDAREILNERLGLKGAVQQLTHDLSVLYQNLDLLGCSNILASEVAAILDRVSPTAISVARIACYDDPVVMHWIDVYECCLRDTRPQIDGHTLQEMGIPRGPIYSRILKSVRNAQLDGLIEGRDQEVALAAEIAQRHSQQNGS